METTSSAGVFFSSARPAAVDMPHLITALDAELIGKVAHLTKTKMGLWNVPAPFDEQDVFERAREAAPLSAWTLPANQAEILSFGAQVQEAIFGTKLMMVDANFDEPTFLRLAVTTGKRLETGAYVTQGYQDLPQLAELVELCSWTLIPVGPERSKGLFLTSRAKADWVAKLEEWCEREGRNQGRVRLENGMLVYVERPAPEKYRNNAVAHCIDGFLGDMEMYFGGADESILGAVGERIRARRQLQENIARSKQDETQV